MELLYADDLVLMAESEEQLLEKLRKWKISMEKKGLRVNMGKTKVMRCQVDARQVMKTGKYPCAVCLKGVGANSILCTSCDAWVHSRCSGIVGS
jgi:Reverse transcriptase (RNA-dependent DNA polymerase)